MASISRADSIKGQGNEITCKRPVYSELKLSVNKVIGTTAANSSSISVAKNIVAFTAGAGVVAASLAGGQLTNQRFYCASTRLVQSIQSTQRSHRIFDETSGYFHTDIYGYPISSAANENIIVLNNPGSSHGSLNTISDDISGLSLSPAKSNSSAKDKMKMTSCTAISNDGKLLAAGEVGHQPRIFIYSLAEDSNNKPLAIISEHRFGVNNLSFSPCGRYLASLGTTNDGFLHIWRISLKEGQVFLHSSNRCISTVKQLQWINSEVLLTAGVRHVRLWKVDDTDKPNLRKPVVLPGKNVILGQYSASTFTAVALIGENDVILATHKGEIARTSYSENENSSTIGIGDIEPLAALSFPVSAMTFDPETNKIWICGDKIQGIDLTELLNNSNLSDSEDFNQQIKGIYPADCDNLIILNEDKELLYFEPENGRKTPLTPGNLTNLNGIRLSTDRIITWSSDGHISAWTFPECQNILKNSVKCSNNSELTAAHVRENTLYTGDSHGNLQISDLQTAELFKFQAHIGRLTDLDIAVRQNIRLLATCSRDRTIQIFIKKPQETWQLLQTLQDTHKGNIQKIRFGSNGERLVSCSNDRTVRLYRLLFDETDQLVGYISEKVLSLKVAPTDMMIDDSIDQFVVVADKQVSIYKLSTAELVRSFRLYDEDNIPITGACLGKIDDTVFIAAMGADKCLRIHDYLSGQILASEYGHSVGISGIVAIEMPEISGLVTSGQDGCIFFWDLSRQTVGPDNESPATVFSPGRVSPTRRVIPKNELTKFLSPTRSPSPGSSVRSRDRSPIRSPILSNSAPRRSLAGPSITGSPTSAANRASMRKSRLSPVRNSEDLDIDRIIQQLQQFRARYSGDTVTERQKAGIEQLKQEMQKTFEVIGNESSKWEELKTSDMNALVEKFGQKVIELVEKRLNDIS